MRTKGLAASLQLAIEPNIGKTTMYIGSKTCVHMLDNDLHFTCDNQSRMLSRRSMLYVEVVGQQSQLSSNPHLLVLEQLLCVE